MSYADARRGGAPFSTKTRFRRYEPILVYAATKEMIYIKFQRIPRPTFKRIAEIAKDHAGEFLSRSKLWAIPRKNYAKARREIAAALNDSP